MNEKQAQAELLKWATDYPEHFSITTLTYNNTFITVSGYGDNTYFRVDVFYQPAKKLHPTIHEELCSKHYESIDEARKAIDKAFRDDQAISECIKAVEYEKLTDLGYELK